jgi:hypothetical protein
VIRYEKGRWEDWEHDLTVPRLTAIQDGWLECPPVDLLVAAYLGYKPPTKEADPLENFMLAFPSGKIGGGAVAMPG